MTAPTCACCGKPLADGAVICRADALSLAERLREAAGHAEDAQTVVARQTRYSGAGGARKTEEEPDTVAEANRRNPMLAFGWQASVERPKNGALRPEPVPVDLDASERLAKVRAIFAKWSRRTSQSERPK